MIGTTPVSWPGAVGERPRSQQRWAPVQRRHSFWVDVLRRAMGVKSTLRVGNSRTRDPVNTRVGARFVVMVLVQLVMASSCVGSGRSEEASAEPPENPTHQLCRSVLDGEPLPRPMANFVIYHWSSLHPWVRTAADEYTSGASVETADELERQCTSFLSMLEG